jgi:hypothetical protein
MMKRIIHYAVPPPPPSDVPIMASTKRSRKKLYAIIVTAILVVAVLIPVLLLFSSGNAAANASSLKYTQTTRYSDANGGGQDTYTVYVKNFGTPNIMSRYEGTYNGEQIISITDEGTRQMWQYYQGRWSDISGFYNATMSSQAWADLRNNLRNWNGFGEVKFTIWGNDVTISDIEVNPSLPDALFQR